MQYAKSHRRVDVDSSGQATQTENAVLAENITNAGDLPESEVDAAGVALMVGIDGKLRRTTLGKILTWLHDLLTAAGFQGPKGDTGATGPQGPTGPQGEVGVGVPAGGTAGQVLAKGSEADYDTHWVTPEAPKAGGGKRASTLVVATSASGYTADDCDYLCTGTNDQEVINTALAALPATGGEVKLMDGKYDLTGTVTAVRNNTRIVGCGPSTILYMAGVNVEIGLDCAGKAGVERLTVVCDTSRTYAIYRPTKLSNVTVGGRGAETGVYGDAHTTLIADCQIYGAMGIWLNEAGYAVIDSCRFVGTPYQAIYLFGCDDVRVRDCHLKNCGPAGATAETWGAAVVLYDCAGCDIHHNSVIIASNIAGTRPTIALYGDTGGSNKVTDNILFGADVMDQSGRPGNDIRNNLMM